MLDVLKIRLMLRYGRVVDAHRAIIDYCYLCNINCSCIIFEILFGQKNDKDNNKADAYGKQFLPNISGIPLN